MQQQYTLQELRNMGYIGYIKVNNRSGVYYFSYLLWDRLIDVFTEYEILLEEDSNLTFYPYSLNEKLLYISEVKKGVQKEPVVEEPLPSWASTMFAIKNNKTGFYMPARDSSHKGATHAPFIDPSEGVPRLFKQRHHAQHSLDWWLKGKYRSWVSYDGELHERIDPMPDREPTDFDIVEVTLSIP